MSKEKRLTILPNGVVSKKDMGARRILPSRRLWSFSAAVTAPVITVTAMPSTPNTEMLEGPIVKKDTYSVVVCRFSEQVTDAK